MELLNLLWGKGAGQASGKVGEVGEVVHAPETHNSVPDFALTSEGQSLLESGWWGLRIPEGGSAGSLEGSSSRSPMKGKHQSCSQESKGNSPHPKGIQLSHWHPHRSAQTSPPWPRQLTYQQGKISAGWSERESRGWGYYFPPGSCHREGNAPAKKDGVFSVGEWLNTWILVAVPSALSPEPQTPTVLLWL